MEWPSGFLGRVEDFELRIILRGGSKMYLSARCQGRSQVRCRAAAGSICLEPRHIRVGYARKVCRMLSPNAVLSSICILGWNLLTIHGPEKSRTDRPVRPTRRIPQFELFFYTPGLLLRISALRRSHRPALLEAFPAKHRPPLCGTEGNCGFLPALRAICLRFRAHR